MSSSLTPNGSLSLVGTPEAFLAGCRADCQTAKTNIGQLRQLTFPRDPVATLEAYDDALSLLGDAAARASVARNAHPDAEMRAAAETAEQEIDAAMTEISLDRGVYDALASVELDGADGATRYYVERTLRDMRRAGVDRDEATRDRVRALREELLRIGQEFGNHIKDDVRSVSLEPGQLDGLPADWKAAHPVVDGIVKVTTDNTDYVPFVTYARDASAREALWRVYRLRAHPANGPVLAKLLEKRHELATLLGYRSWADYATEDKMIGSAAAASSFIARIATASRTRGDRDFARLLAEKQKDFPNARSVDPWDSGYYSERVGAAEYGFDSQEIRPYFEYRRVRDGVLDVTGRLFGVRYVRVEDAPVWHSEVEVYDVVDGDQRLGRVYLDMHSRDGKYKHYAQFTLVNGVRGKKLPEGVLMCNFPRPGAEPALMEHDGVRTFLHELGHLLHHILGGATRWAGQSGVATEWDFVEAPSQLLEEWVWDTATLQSFARHYETNQPIPEELVKKAKAADNFGKGLWVRQQMFYAAVSLEYHQRTPGSFDPTVLMAELQAEHTPYRWVEGTYFHESFGHLDGYSAIYYTYMWSLVIAKDLFGQFASLGPSPVAERYRKSILEAGGSKPAAKLVEDFLGRPYAFDAYARWLDAA